MRCRHCKTTLEHCFIDLGFAPPSNAYVESKNYSAAEVWYPLKVMVCHTCWLVQTEDHADREDLFSENYAYFSSFSESWLGHSKSYVEEMQKRFPLNETSMVCEIAANDGYLLQYVKNSGIPCYGIEPTASTAKAAREKGLEIVGEFFGITLAKKLVSEGKSADLLTANNVLAHVPDINDFIQGFAILLKESGVVTFEFPHVLNLINQMQFDTIYHEHYSYLSLIAVKDIFKVNGLDVFDVEELSTHGGSLRVFAQRSDAGKYAISSSVEKLLEQERIAGIDQLQAYEGFQTKAETIKNNLLKFLIEAKEQGKKVAGYGAAAKGNTILNFAGIRPDLLSFIVDKNPAKAGQFMPASHIPIVNENHLKQHKPDYILILPWNLKTEIAGQLQYINEWGGQCVIAMPEIEIIC